MPSEIPDKNSLPQSHGSAAKIERVGVAASESADADGRSSLKDAQSVKAVRSPLPNDNKAVFAMEHYSGPLPSPDYFRQYNEILPGAAERILLMAERQSDHRRLMQQKALDAEVADSVSQRRETRRGQYFAFCLCAFIVLSGLIVNIVVNPIAGTIVSLSGLAGLASTFIRTQKPDKEEKADMPKEVGNGKDRPEERD